jgi:HEAT repeat protein
MTVDELIAAVHSWDDEALGKLLSRGADPNQVDRNGRTPLSVAAEHGAVEIVEALLAHDADPTVPDADGQTAYQIASRLASTNIEAELESRAKRQAQGRPGTEAIMIFTREELYGGTELVRAVPHTDEGPVELAMETGHAAIARILEPRLEIRLPFAKLTQLALAHDDPDDAERWAIIHVLQRRGDTETFQGATELCASTQPSERLLGADILAQLGVANGRPFLEQSLPILRRMAEQESDPTLLYGVIFALGHHADERALPEVVRLAGHDSEVIRDAVAHALPRVLPQGHTEGLSALIRLTQDTDDEIRDWATAGLAGLEDDNTVIREALYARLDDPCLIIAVEGARGLALRGDRRGLDGVRRYLTEPPDGEDWYMRDLVLETAEELGDTQLLQHLNA